MTDYQAYRLGLSLEILEKIQSYRNGGGYINSLEVFGQVTDLPDALLEQLKPQLRFPSTNQTPRPVRRTHITLQDINTATAEELKTMNGIGEILSARILKFRTALGGFIVNDQIYDVYGLDSVVAQRLLRRFSVKNPPQVERIPINRATAAQLAANVYISWDFAREIVTYREHHGRFETWAELEALEYFPDNRIARIRLYLSLEKKLLE